MKESKEEQSNKVFNKKKETDGFVAKVYEGDKEIANYDTFVISGHANGANPSNYMSTVSMQGHLSDCIALLSSLSGTLVGLITDVSKKYEMPPSTLVDLIKIASLLESKKTIKDEQEIVDDDPTVPENMKNNLWKIKEGNG
jgi:hypothetical protein